MSSRKASSNFCEAACAGTTHAKHTTYLLRKTSGLANHLNIQINPVRIVSGQFGFFDLANRYDQLSSQGDPLERLNTVVDWKIFLPLINRAFYKIRKSPAGRKPFNRLMMFKVLLRSK
jgi:hypothetical protein